MNILGLELRRSSLKWAVLPVTAAWAWLVFRLDVMWLGSWPAASGYSTALLPYAVVLFGGLTAWDSARRREEAPSAAVRLSRRSLSANVAQFSASLIWSVIPFAVILIAISVRNIPNAPAGWFWPSYLLFGFAMMIVAVSSAQLVGIVAPSQPLAAILGSFCGFVITFFGDVPLHAPVHLILNPARVASAVLFALLGLLFAILLPTLMYSSSASTIRSSLVALAGITAIGILFGVIYTRQLGEIQIARPLDVDAVCTDSVPRVCVWPEHAAFLPKLEPIANGVAEAAHGVLPVPGTFLEQGLSGDQFAYNNFVFIGRDDGLWQVAKGFANGVLNTDATLQACLPATEHDWDEFGTASDQLAHWLAMRGFGGDRPGTWRGEFNDVTSATDAVQLSDGDQSRWAIEQVNRMHRVPCEPNVELEQRRQQIELASNV